MLRMVSALALAATLLAPATPAFAASARPAICVWEHLPQEKRDRMLEIYDRSVDEGMTTFLFSESELADATKACRVEDFAGMGEALGSYEIEVATSSWLERQHGVSATELEDAWSNAETAVARSLEVEDGMERFRRIEPALIDAARRLGIPEAQQAVDPPSDAMTRLFLYLVNRGRREQIEASSTI